MVIIVTNIYPEKKTLSDRDDGKEVPLASNKTVPESIPTFIEIEVQQPRTKMIAKLYFYVDKMTN